MKSTGKDHWRDLSVFLGRAPLIANRRLRWPCLASLPPEPLLTSLRNLARYQGLLPLFDRHLLSALALPENVRPKLGQLPSTAALAFPGHTEKALLNTLWCCLPILTCQGASASVTWLLLGRMPGAQYISFIGDPQPEASSLKAAATAFAATRCHPFLVTHGYLAILIQCPDDPPLTGGSLALPLALGMLWLERGKSWPQGVYASGGLADDGRILAVTGEERKYRSIATSGMHMLIYPDRGQLEAIPNAKVVRCDHLKQAVFALDCLPEGFDAGEIAHYRACLANPGRFLEQFMSLPLELLNSAAGRELLVRIRDERHQLLPALASCLADCSGNPERGALLANLFNVEEIAAISRQDSDEALAAHQWCVARIAYASRSGAVADSQAWIGLTHDLAQTIGVRKRIECANHAFVTTRFNRYDFRPEMPSDFAKYFAIEQRLYGIDQRDNRALGAMYGTLAQNYGFCGPAYRQQFADSIRRAEAAFGREYRQENRRLLSYRIYSFLDSAQYQKAADLLCRYLDLPSGSDPQQWIATIQHLCRHPTEHASFQTAIVCRLLVELAQNGHMRSQPDWSRSLAAILPDRLSHPWQLTACNLGQLFLAAGLDEQGITLLHRSAEACVAGEIALVPMTLMPLAILYKIHPDNASVLLTCGQVVRTIRTSSLLHQPHFQPLVNAPTPAQALEEVLANLGRYFPFSYR